MTNIRYDSIWSKVFQKLPFAGTSCTIRAAFDHPMIGKMNIKQIIFLHLVFFFKKLSVSLSTLNIFFLSCKEQRRQVLVARIVAEIAVIIPTPVTPACLSNMFCLKIFYFQPLSLLEFHHGAVPIICALCLGWYWRHGRPWQSEVQ